jgi:hypothetical protein
MRVALRGWVGFVEAATIDWLSSEQPATRESLRNFLIEVLFGTVQIAVAAK